MSMWSFRKKKAREGVPGFWSVIPLKVRFSGWLSMRHDRAARDRIDPYNNKRSDWQAS